MNAADLVYGLHKESLLRSCGYYRPKGALWFRAVSLAWLAGYKLEWVDAGRFALRQRDLPPFTFESTVTVDITRRADFEALAEIVGAPPTGLLAGAPETAARARQRI